MFPGDLPRQDHPLPKALDDAAAAKLLRAAQADPRLLVRVTVEVLLRTGLRVGEFTALRADAVVQIGAGPWLHVPVGKLREDRYLPLHPHLVDPHRRLPHRATSRRAPAAAAPGERPSRWTGTPSPGCLNKAGAAAGLPHIHPHQLRHTLATQAINRGMSLEAIAAMLGHRSMDMTLRYAKIANRTVADEYFAVTDKVDALYDQGQPAARRRDRTEDGPAAPRAPPTARQRLLHPTTRARLRLRVDLRDLHASSRPASSSGPPCKPSTTTPRTKGPAPPRRPLRPAPHRPHGRRSIMSRPPRSWHNADDARVRTARRPSTDFRLRPAMLVQTSNCHRCRPARTDMSSGVLEMIDCDSATSSAYRASPIPWSA